MKLTSQLTSELLRQILPKSPAVKLNSENWIRVLHRWNLHLFYWIGKPSYPVDNLRGVLGILLNWLQTSGFRGVILRLKISAIVVRKYLAGEKLENTQSLGMRVRLSNGLPVWIPLRYRSLIRARNSNWIRYWITFLDLYRSLSSPYPLPDFSSITAPPLDTGSLAFGMWKYFSVQFWQEFAPSRLMECSRARDGVSHLRRWFEYDLGFALHSSSPLGRSSNSRQMDVFATMWEVCSPVGFNLPHAILSWINPLSARFMDLFIVRDGSLCRDWGWDFERGGLAVFSRLHFIGESAGKVRVIAILDYWTQFVMKPVHDFLFSILREHSTCDATFDQNGVLAAFVKRTAGSPYFCYDLKSATDMIPFSLSLELLTPIFGSTFVDAIRLLLVERDFQVGNDRRMGSVRYTRGQPMGALGSWSIMSITHHALVRFAAFKVGLTQFTDYLVLGDDLVIANAEVAKAYLGVCEEFGIPIGLAKSYTSVIGFLEFARKSYLAGMDISPISFKDYQDNTLSGLVNRAWKLFSGGFQPKTNPLVRLSRFALTRAESSCLHDGIRANGAVYTVLVNRLSLLLVPTSSGRTLAAALGLSPEWHLVAWIELLGGHCSIIQGLCHNRAPQPLDKRELGYVVSAMSDLMLLSRTRTRSWMALERPSSTSSLRPDLWPNRWSLCAFGFQTAAYNARMSYVTRLSKTQMQFGVDVTKFLSGRVSDWQGHFFKLFDLFVGLLEIRSVTPWSSQLDLFAIAQQRSTILARKESGDGLTTVIQELAMFVKIRKEMDGASPNLRRKLEARLSTLRKDHLR